MASLDVGWVLADPAFNDAFQVRRNEETVGTNGRMVKTAIVPPVDASGSVQPKESQVLKREDDQQYVVNVIEIITPFPLHCAQMGFQPDVVIWQNREYTVTSVMPWRFGGGFFECEATSERATER